MSERFIVLCGQVVGNLQRGFEIVHNWTGEKFSTREAAIKHGFQIRESDDFNIGILKGRKLVWFGWMGKSDETADLRAIERELFP